MSSLLYHHRIQINQSIKCQSTWHLFFNWVGSWTNAYLTTFSAISLTMLSVMPTPKDADRSKNITTSMSLSIITLLRLGPSLQQKWCWSPWKICFRTSVNCFQLANHASLQSNYILCRDVFVNKPEPMSHSSQSNAAAGLENVAFLCIAKCIMSITFFLEDVKTFSVYINGALDIFRYSAHYFLTLVLERAGVVEQV